MMNLSRDIRIVVVGVGGTGTYLIETLCQFLNGYMKARFQRSASFVEMKKEAIDDIPSFSSIRIILVDGDKFEDRNNERQLFSNLGMKAEVKYNELMTKYDRLDYEFVNEYITSDNAPEIIKDGDVVFICVDNHVSRKIINDHCKSLENTFVFSGGNGFHMVNSQRFIKINGVEIRPNLTEFHPEIEDGPPEEHPNEIRNNLGCEEMGRVEPQLVFANMGSALLMLISFYKEIILGFAIQENKISDTYFDLLQAMMVSKEFHA